MIATSASHSLVYGSGITSCQAGVACRFVVQTRDAYNTPNNVNDIVTLAIDGTQVGG